MTTAGAHHKAQAWAILGPADEVRGPYSQASLVFIHVYIELMSKIDKRLAGCGPRVIASKHLLLQLVAILSACSNCCRTLRNSSAWSLAWFGISPSWVTFFFTDQRTPETVVSRLAI